LGIGIAIRKETLELHKPYVHRLEEEQRLSFESKCPLCEAAYVVYCDPGVKEQSAREEFDGKIWNEHPRHSEVIAIGEAAA